MIRTLGEKIIAFLAQLENFQKKLWLKKKFVTETQYCITLDRLSDHPQLLEQVFDNEAQRKDWANLYALDLEQLEVDRRELSLAELLEQPKYRFLMLDTCHFSNEFKAELLATIEDLDKQCDGLLVHSENFQALNLLQERYREQVKCIYIDPPYNTGGDGFAYKDRYQHSTWLSMIRDRLCVSSSLIQKDGALFASISDVEVNNLKAMLSDVLGPENFEAQIVIQSNKRGQTYQSIAKTHEYLLVYQNSDLTSFGELPKELPKNALKDEIGAYELWELRNRNPKFGRHNRPNLFYPIYVDTSSENEEGMFLVSLEDRGTGYQAVFPKNSIGEDSCWRWGKEKLGNAIDASEYSCVVAKKKRDGGWNIYEKARKSTTKAKTIWSEVEVISEQGTTEAGALGLKNFGFPKPISLIKKACFLVPDDRAIVLDYFSGSGTTGHAVINLNRDDGGRRKYLLVEMGAYFDSVLRRRIKKAVYSDNWKAGAPVNDVEGNTNGVSHCVKYIRLESYEDTLGNLALHRDKGQQSLLEAPENSELDAARQSYVMNYMLEVETRGSASLLNTRLFTDPTAYQLKVRSASGDETKTVNVDLLETFNYLLGLEVEHIAAPLWFDAEITQGEFGRWQAQVKHIKAEELKAMDDAQRARLWWFRTVYGVNRAGQKVLVVWRNLPSVIASEEKGLLKDNAVLDAVLIEKLRIRLTSSQDDEVDILYVNGDHNINIPKNRRGELMEEARIQLIEEAFHRLMFANTESGEL